MIVCSPDFDFLSARFSLSDFPDFFDMDLRGDLSDIIGPSIGNLNGPDASTVRHIQLVPRIVDQHFMTIGGEVPTQAFTITRLLLAFLHRAVEGPVDQDDWEQLWATEELPYGHDSSVCHQRRQALPLSICLAESRLGWRTRGGSATKMRRDRLFLPPTWTTRSEFQS